MRLLSRILRTSALLSEELFWRYWVFTGGRSSDVTLASLLDPQRPFTAELRPFVDATRKAAVRVLDVGAGPITHIGRAHPTLKIEVVATDFLANQYNRILSLHKVAPPVATVFADAEKLCDQFQNDSFDLAVANNSLDHCQSPVTAIEQMLKVVMPGAFVYLRHRENEAVRAKYRGLHQWNFAVVEGRACLWNRQTHIDIAAHLGPKVSVQTLPETDHAVVVLHKLAS